MLLIRSAEIYSPAAIGVHDLLIAGQQICAIARDIEIPGNLPHQVIDGSGLKLLPGFIDPHVHVAGAGGEGGPGTRTPEIQLSQLIEGGVTTVVGCQGTDGLTRSPEAVLMKVKSLREEGISAWMFTGSYQYPLPTILGDVGRDIAMIDEVIGAGELAVSDHRSSAPSTRELIRAAAHARVGGMLGRKAGLVNVHMGDAKNPFQPIIDAVNHSELKFTQFYPTHCNRNEWIYEDSKTYGRKGYLDVTTSSYPYFMEDEIKPSHAIRGWLEAGVPLEHITLSSDAHGSLPGFDEQGNLVKLEMGQPRANFDELVATVTEENIPLEKALQVVTSNTASILKLPRKGNVAVGCDADLVLMDKDFQMQYVIALGQVMMEQGRVIRKGSYES